MTDDDMFEHMDSILGEKCSDIVGTGGATPTRNVGCEIPISTQTESDDSKPSAIWVKDLKLWGVKDE